MCIIVAIPRKTPFPTVETMKECFRRNPDGAGFMYADGKSVQIRKGFMKFDDFVNALEGEDIPEDTAVVLHFRIATSGKVKPSTCHPFPISDSKDELQALKTACRFGLAHNGVISGRTTYEGWSDTMDFTANVVTPLARMNPSFMHSTEAKELLKGACMSKLAILDNSGDMMLVGDFVEDKGIFYSNTSYLPVKTDWSSYANWWNGAWYEDEEDEAAWDAIVKQVAKLKWQACQLCTEQYECAEYGEWCHSERTAIEACADASGMEETELAELLGWPTYALDVETES